MKFEYSDGDNSKMRIPARWLWIPLAITVSGIVYLSLAKLADYQAAKREPAVVGDSPRPFVPPPGPKKQEVAAVPEPPAAEVAPLRTQFPVFKPASRPAELPPYRARKTR